MLLALSLSACRAVPCRADAGRETDTSFPQLPAPPPAPTDPVRSLDVALGVRRTFRLSASDTSETRSHRPLSRQAD